MRRIERQVLKLWQKADTEKQRYFPYEFMYQLIRGCYIKEFFENRSERLLGDRRVRKEPADFTPGWETRRLGIFSLPT